VVADAAEKFAAVPLKRTAVAPVKFVPLMVTLTPAPPLVGVTLAMDGGLTTPEATTTSCSMLALWACASVAVSRTYFVPTPLNVNAI
jgi:hypothetical protein